MRGKTTTKVIAAICSTAMVATPVLAESANQLVDINGMYASDAERALRDRGFSHESSHDSHSSGYTYSYWWDREDDNCVRVEEHNGRVDSIVDAEDGDCGHGGGGVGTALAIGAGAAILGAILSSRSHHRDNEEDDAGENRQQFDAGYRDGLYNYAYHNPNRSDSYSRGYQAGVDERAGNERNRNNRGGYHQAATFGDLQGARAAGGMSELERRGFEQVDNFTSGNTRYSIQWNGNTHQCLQVTIADGHFYDIRDIGQHPRCGGSSGGRAGSSNDTAWIGRLVGAASDGMRSYMSNQGFRRVDRFDSGRNGEGSVWYNRSNRQCVQIIAVNGRVDSAMDIGQHPRCR